MSRWCDQRGALRASGRRVEQRGALGHPLRGAARPARSSGQIDALPTPTVDHASSQAYLKSAAEMSRLFGKMPSVLRATVEVAQRCTFSAYRSPGIRLSKRAMARRYCSDSSPRGSRAINGLAK